MQDSSEFKVAEMDYHFDCTFPEEQVPMDFGEPLLNFFSIYDHTEPVFISPITEHLEPISFMGASNPSSESSTVSSPISFMQEQKQETVPSDKITVDAFALLANEKPLPSSLPPLPSLPPSATTPATSLRKSQRKAKTSSSFRKAERKGKTRRVITREMMESIFLFHSKADGDGIYSKEERQVSFQRYLQRKKNRPTTLPKGLSSWRSNFAKNRQRLRGKFVTDHKSKEQKQDIPLKDLPVALPIALPIIDHEGQAPHTPHGGHAPHTPYEGKAPHTPYKGQAPHTPIIETYKQGGYGGTAGPTILLTETYKQGVYEGLVPHRGYGGLASHHYTMAIDRNYTLKDVDYIHTGSLCILHDLYSYEALTPYRYGPQRNQMRIIRCIGPQEKPAAFILTVELGQLFGITTRNSPTYFKEYNRSRILIGRQSPFCIRKESVLEFLKTRRAKVFPEAVEFLQDKILPLM